MKAKKQVLADVAHRRRRKAARPQDAGQVAFDERDAGALDRDVRAGAHGDADIGGGKRRRVVHAVAGHRDDAALVARSRVTTSLFRSGKTSASTSSMPRRRATASAVVRLSPVSMTIRIPSRLSAATTSALFRLHRIGNADRPGEASVDGDEDRGRAVLAELFRRAAQSGCASTPILARDRRRCRPQRAGRRRWPLAPFPVGESKSATGSELQPALLGRAHDRLRERMLARALHARRELQELLARQTPRPGRSRSPPAGLRSACRSCRRRACRPSPSARAPRRRGSGRRPVAPRPTPTMIDIGVARPSAQGQAMISTATAATRP